MSNIDFDDEIRLGVEGVQAVLLFTENVSHDRVIASAYDINVQEHRGYADEKIGKLKKYGLATFWGALDLTNRRRLVRAALTWVDHQGS